MATVVPFASCYGGSAPLQLFGRGHRNLFAHRGPRFAPRPRLAYQTPKMTLRQILHLLKVMKQVRNREAAAAAAAAAAARKQGSASPAPPSPGNKPDRKCVPTCLRHKRSIKRVG